MIASLKTRLAKLEAGRTGFRYPDRDSCPKRDENYTLVFPDDEPLPDDTPRCPLCGDPHACEVVEVIVATREEAAIAQAAVEDDEPLPEGWLRDDRGRVVAPGKGHSP